MSAAAISKPQIGTIHALKGRLGFDDDTYRDFLERETGKRSSTELTGSEAIRVIDTLKQRAGPAPSKPPLPGLDGPYAPKLRALWISAWHLGVARDRRDTALLAFVKRQTGLDHIAWLRDPYLSNRAIEGLKAWLAREAGVDWDLWPDDPYRCVVAAQLTRLGSGAPAHASAAFATGQTEGVMAELGALIRELPKDEGAE